MTIYQKAIKIRKTCQSKITCEGCNYFSNCKNTNMFFYSPAEESIEKISKIIKKEKWNVK